VTAARGADGRRVALDRRRAYRLAPAGSDRLALTDVRSGRRRARLRAPVRLTGPAPLQLRGAAENGVADGGYRGVLVLSRSAAGVLVVDDVGIERYCYGVVPAEMPASWPAAALAAQAVTARSYGLASRRPAAPFDVHVDTRSQVYRGVVAEAAATTAAVRATRGIALTAAGQVVRPLFHSSSGGRTAAVEEVFGGDPVGWLRSVEDPYDSLSPYHDWTVTLSDAATAERLRSVLAGELVDVAVTATTATGRAALVRVTGSLGARDISAADARALLGLRSTWFGVRRTAPLPAQSYE
jgi:stage II sporulation protein D